MLKTIALSIALSFVFPGTSCSMQPGAFSDEFEVSLVRLIATPEKYDGKIIQVVGYLNLEFEGNAIYLHQEDYEHGLTKNGFWVDLPDSMRKVKKPAEYSKKYVILVGKFDMKSHGHMGLFGGTLKDISRLDTWQ